MDDGEMSRAPKGRMEGLFKNNRRVFSGDVAQAVATYEWGKEVVPGITAVGDAGAYRRAQLVRHRLGLRQGLRAVGRDQCPVAVRAQSGLARHVRPGPADGGGDAAQGLRHVVAEKMRSRASIIRSLRSPMSRRTAAAIARSGAVESARSDLRHTLWGPRTVTALAPRTAPVTSPSPAIKWGLTDASPCDHNAFFLKLGGAGRCRRRRECGNAARARQLSRQCGDGMRRLSHSAHAGRLRDGGSGSPAGSQTWDEAAYTVKGSNITPDRDTGIGSSSQADLKRLLRDGIRPSGVPTWPIRSR